jgi:hypothetical protein
MSASQEAVYYKASLRRDMVARALRYLEEHREELRGERITTLPDLIYAALSYYVAEKQGRRTKPRR